MPKVTNFRTNDPDSPEIQKTRSICPVCFSVIDARIVREDNKILITKECKDHGSFTDIYFSDPDTYKRFAKFKVLGTGVSNPMTGIRHGCPYDCGICPEHKTSTILANIDVTNRCNFQCPICFANARKSGYVYEPTVEQIRKMLETLIHEKPVPCYAIQFAGGEPTVRKDLPELINMAKSMGFIQVQIATNGMKFAQSKEYCKELRKTPVSTIYMQFDGVTEEPYIKARGFNALPFKLKAIQNMRETGLNNIVLVPTLVKGINSDQIFDIVKFGIKNLDVVRGVNFQPVSFTGRIEKSELHQQRITIPDFLDLIEKQSGGVIRKTDFYPVPCVAAISDVVEAWTGQPQVKFTVHPHCGTGTYVFRSGDDIVPITKFVDVGGLLEFMERISNECKGNKLAKVVMVEKLMIELPKYIDSSKLPRGLDLPSVMKSLIKGKGSIGALADFHTKGLLIGAMHFQDPYNLDLDRVRRCGIHYATPDGRVIPFCTYNTFYRESVERQFSKPYVEQPGE